MSDSYQTALVLFMILFSSSGEVGRARKLSVRQASSDTFLSVSLNLSSVFLGYFPQYFSQSFLSISLILSSVFLSICSRLACLLSLSLSHLLCLSCNDHPEKISGLLRILISFDTLPLVCQVLFPHYSDQKSHWSEVSEIALL